MTQPLPPPTHLPVQDVPPYQLQTLLTLPSVSIGSPVRICCAQALGSEVYVGCSNGELLRYALQNSGGGPETPSILPAGSYTLLSRQSLPAEKPIDEIVLVPSISRVFVLSDRQIHFYTLPALDPLSPQIKPLRNIEAIAVDELQLRKFSPPGLTPTLNSPQPSNTQTGSSLGLNFGGLLQRGGGGSGGGTGGTGGGGGTGGLEPVDFCVLKRSSIAVYSYREKLVYRTEMPLPGGVFARRSGHHLCIAANGMYNIVDLNLSSSLPILPISQAPDDDDDDPKKKKYLKPSITVVGPNEFLLLTWTGEKTMGIFITGEGDPVRGTLEWEEYPESLILDYPHVISLLPSQAVEIHNIESQVLVQSLSFRPLHASILSPPFSPPPPPIKSPTQASFSGTSGSHRHQRNLSMASSRSVGSQGGRSANWTGLVVCASPAVGYYVPIGKRESWATKVKVGLVRGNRGRGEDEGQDEGEDGEGEGDVEGVEVVEET